MIKPFKLDKLKKVSLHEVEFIRALYEFLPATDVRDKFHVGIRKALMKNLGKDIRYYLSAIEKKKWNDFAVTLPESPVLMVLGLTPLKEKAIIHLDHNIANIIINKLLGGDDSMANETRPLTETEQGVIQYLVMQILSGIYSATGSEPRVHFRFEKFIFDPSGAAKLTGAGGDVCVLTEEIGISGQSGFIHMVFPDPFLKGILNLPRGAGDTKGERDYFVRQLERWGYVMTSVWAEAGNCLLSAAEMADLESGDVVLFDESRLEISGKKISGEVKLHFGSSEREVSGELTKMDKKKIGCKLTDIIR